MFSTPFHLIVILSFSLFNLFQLSSGILRHPPNLNSDLQNYNTQTGNNRNGKSIITHPTVYRCGEIGKDLVVNFVNRNYPDNDNEGGDCFFRLVIGSPHICQVRVDFVDTEMLFPVKGDCLSQMFEIEGNVWSSGIPPLCGTNNDNHFYLHLESWSANSSWVDFRLLTVFSGKPYRFGVWLTQIDCSSFNVLKAPEGCTQYFLGEKGTIKSFNFESHQHLNGENYQICIRPGKSVCGVKYESNQGDFHIRKSILATRDIHMKSGVGSTICGLDYLLIPGGKDTLDRVRNNRNQNRNGRLLFRRRPTRPSLIIIQTGPNPTQKPKPAANPSSTIVPIIQKQPVRNRNRNQHRIKFFQSQDRFCGGTLAPNGGSETSRPIFARVRSNLITLRVRTATSFERKNTKRMNMANLPQGFRISYTQLRDCNHDNDTMDLANQPSIMHLLQHIHLNNHNDPPLLRDEEQGQSGELSGNSSEMTYTNSTVPADDESDKLWDYLDDNDNDNDSGNEEDADADSNSQMEESEDELYDF